MKTGRIIALVLICAIFFSLMPMGVMAEETLTLPSAFHELYPNLGDKTPIRPVHQYLYRQNPPNFLWPVIDGAESYDLIICSDEALTKVCYKVEKIENNYYSFKEPFEKNKYYWWAMRYNKSGASSEWCVARRFKIADDSTEIILPTADQIISKMGKEHPRFFFTDESLPELKDTLFGNEYNNAYFELIRGRVEGYIKKGIISEPVGKDFDNVRADIIAHCTYAMEAAEVYNLTGDSRYGDYAVDCLKEFIKWDYKSDDAPTAFKNGDVDFMRATGLTALAYDWMYDYMTPEERETIARALFDRAVSAYGYVSGVIKTIPYNSHEWSGFQSFGIAFGVFLGEIPEAKEYFDDFCELLIANFIPLSIEDGGYGKGTRYWKVSMFRDYLFMEGLTMSGVYDFFDIPFLQNQYLWAIYMVPSPTSFDNPWGDGSYVTAVNFAEWLANGGAKVGVLADKPEMLWWKSRMATVQRCGDYLGLLFIDTDLDKGRAPVDHPRDWHFKDQGMTAMHSDLINEPRISAWFRSGMYGAYGHAQADINAFVIEAGSIPLAWRNGYYNYWGSDHHRYIAKASFTHNTITYDNGIGQANYENNFDADGVTTMYLSNTHMAAAVGDGKEAYLGGLEKFDRTFIYLRPDSFIVIDNLEASHKNKKENGGSTFEWWINSIGTIDVHDDNRGVAITNKEKALDARVHYPENAEPFYSNLLAGTDGIEIMPTPAIEPGSEVPQERVWFKTDKVEKTKMVVTMDARDIEKQAEYVKSTEYENYMELQFEDGTIAYVSLETDETQMVDTGEFKFNGTAVVKSFDHLMFIGGTELYIREQKVIEASRPVAVTMGFDELGVSSGDDYDITIYPNELYMPKADSVRFRNDEEPVGMGMGVEVTKDKKTGALKVHADKGHYSFLLNNKPLPGDSKKGTYTYTLVIDGVEEVHKTTNLKYDPDYNVVASDYVVKTALKEGVDYAITEVEGKAKYNGKALTGSEALIYSPSNELYLEEDNCKIHIRTIKRVDVEGERTEDCDTREKEASVIKQAEDFVSVHKARHSAGAAFPCLAQLNDVDAEAVYDVEIPESGYYDFLFKYATSTTITQRFFEIDSTRYFFTCESTGSYGGKPSDFRVLTADTNIYLEKGKYKIKLGANGVGNVNIDWFGFIKKN